jgi:hypothetical protein
LHRNNETLETLDLAGFSKESSRIHRMDDGLDGRKIMGILSSDIIESLHSRTRVFTRARMQCGFLVARIQDAIPKEASF